MKVLIVDDEAPARARLEQMVRDITDVEVVGSAADGYAALEQAQQHKPDVVLLDIQMPLMDGLEAAHHLTRLDEPPAVIFTTAFSEHALAAFEAQAVDYLLKPIRRERLLQALERVTKRTYMPQGRRQISTQHHGNIRLILIEDIFCFQADSKYVTAFHRHGEAVLDESLKQLEGELADRFVRVHRNALVSRAYLVGMERTRSGGYCAVLAETGLRPEISRRHLSDIRRLLKV